MHSTNCSVFACLNLPFDLGFLLIFLLSIDADEQYESSFANTKLLLIKFYLKILLEYTANLLSEQNW